MNFYTLYKYIPDFLISLIFQIFLLFLPNKRFKIIKKKTNSKRNLIYLDIENAIGDFTIYIRNLIYENNENHLFDVIVNEKFRGILEKLNLKNINIMYRKGSDNRHYDLNQKFDVDEVLKEARAIKYEYDNVYYLCTNIFLEPILFFSQLKYNKLIKMKEIYKNSYKKTIWFNKNYLFESLYTYSKKRQLKIKTIGDNSLRNAHFVDYAYYIMHGELPQKSLLEINIWEYYKTEIQTNTVGVLLDYSKRNKFLKKEYLLEVLNSKYENYNVIFLGINIDLNKFLDGATIKFVPIDKTTKNNRVSYLFDEIAKVQEVLAFDTCILHIGAILNKKTYLISNKNEKVCKYRFDAWDNYSFLKEFSYIKMPENKFYE